MSASARCSAAPMRRTMNKMWLKVQQVRKRPIRPFPVITDEHIGDMKAMLRPFVLAAGLALALLASAPIAQAAPAAANLTQQQRQEIARIEQYLDGVKTLKSEFVQAGNDGSLVKGTIWLSRP